MINLYEVFTRLHFDYGDVALITAKNKFIYKSKQIQMNVLRFELNVSRSINNNIVKNVLMYLQLMKQWNNLQSCGIKNQLLTTWA